MSKLQVLLLNAMDEHPVIALGSAATVGCVVGVIATAMVLL